MNCRLQKWRDCGFQNGVWSTRRSTAAGALLLAITACGGNDSFAPSAEPGPPVSATTLSTGSVRVITATSGVGLDANGYAVTIDDSQRTGIDLTDTVTITGVPTGTRSVYLRNVMGNCQHWNGGTNPRNVTVSAGATTTTKFTISCVTNTAPVGNIQIVTTTTGSNIDPDGYTYTVDSTAIRPIGVNATAMVSGFRVGTSQVLLDGLAPNCSVAGSNPVTVQVAQNTTVQAAFAISCTSTGQGSIRVTTATTTPGILPDPNGYKVQVDGGTAQSIGLDASVTIAGLAPGSHTVLLGGMAGNCAVNGANPATVSVTSNTTTPVTMAVTCGNTLKQNQIMFLSTRGGTTTNLYLMNDDGSNVLRITNTPFNEQDIAISPDGTTMVFSRIDMSGRYQIYRMRFDGSAAVNISSNAYNDTDPEWAPDGTKLAFETNRSGSEEVWFMNPDGSSPVQLTNNGGENGDVDWSPDGTKIVFESHLNGKTDIYVINADGTGITNLTPGTPNAFDADPNWSPNGSMITFQSDRAKPGAGTSAGTYQVYVMNANGSNLRRVTQTTVTEAEPDWSPEGTRLAFNSKLPGNFEVYTISLNGSNRVRLTNNAAFDGYPEWTRPAPTTFLAQNASFAVERAVATAAAAAPMVPRCVTEPSAPGCRPTVVIPDWQTQR